MRKDWLEKSSSISSERVRHPRSLCMGRTSKLPVHSSRAHLVPLRPHVYFYEEELRRIGGHVRDRRRSETGGELYGLLSNGGSLVVSVATGPGWRAVHGVTSFHQDRYALVRTFGHLNRRHCLQHLGSWHSHHGLSLAEPSGGDISTMVSVLRQAEVPGHFMVIANLVDERGKPDRHGVPELRAYLFRSERPDEPVPCEITVLPGASPVRATDTSLAVLDTYPGQPVAVCVRGPAPEPEAPSMDGAAWVGTEEGLSLLADLHSALRPRAMRRGEGGVLSLDLEERGVLELGALHGAELVAYLRRDGQTTELTGPATTLPDRMNVMEGDLVVEIEIDGVPMDGLVASAGGGAAPSTEDAEVRQLPAESLPPEVPGPPSEDPPRAPEVLSDGLGSSR